MDGSYGKYSSVVLTFLLYMWMMFYSIFESVFVIVFYLIPFVKLTPFLSFSCAMGISHN